MKLIDMEGTLCKWTNYWNGWQPRWFVLDQGVLTYYKSHDEVNQGCKGSVKISACEIIPNQLDSKRFDITIPSEQHYYLKANTESERQQWLVALGSVKQAVVSAQTSSAIQRSASPDAKQTALKMKKPELRMYSNLLMQQVHTIKTTVDQVERTHAVELLESSCDMFVKYLDECMRIAERVGEDDNKEVRPPLLSFNSQGAVTGMVGGLEKHKRSLSASVSSSVTRSIQINFDEREKVHQSPKPPTDNQVSSGNNEAVCDMNSNIESVGDSSSEHNNTDSSADSLKTFFSLMSHSFTRLTITDNKIPIKEFLDCCRAILPVFDVLGSTAFSPVKMDIQGNIDKLEKRRMETGCEFLLELVQFELDSDSAPKVSATESLLWLKRALAFICIFINEACREGQNDLTQCASTAYTETLRKHHNFVVKGVFAVALRALPYYSSFIRAMAPSAEIADHPDYEVTFKQHGTEYTERLQHIVTTIDTFYVQNDIVSPEYL